jgi:hypothetical protein
MASRPDNFPWEYLRQASVRSLESYELAHLGHAANLRKEIASLVDQWVEETANALVARWLLEHWTQLHSSTESFQNSLDLDAPPLRKTPASLRAMPRDPARETSE